LFYVSGENSIAIVAGANLLLSEKDILNAESLITSSRVLICQLEICESITFAALALAHKHGGMYMLLYVNQLLRFLLSLCERCCSYFLLTTTNINFFWLMTGFCVPKLTEFL